MALANEYGLSLDDAMSGNVDDSDFTTATEFSGFGRTSQERLQRMAGWTADGAQELSFAPADRYLWQHLPRLYAVRIGVDIDSDGDNVIKLFGLSVDVAIYQYIRQQINDAFAVHWDVARYVLSVHEPEKLRGRNVSGMTPEQYQQISFNRGMAARLVERINELIALSEQDSNRDHIGTNSGVGASLVVCKNALVEAKAKEVGFVDATGGKAKSVYTDGATGAMGYKAGNSVDLRKNVATSQSALRISKR